MKPSCDNWLFTKPRAQESETKCGKFRKGGAFWNLSENSRKYYHFSSRRFQGMLEKIPGNIINDFRKNSRRFRGMFHRIPGDVSEDSREWSKIFQGMVDDIENCIKAMFYSQ